MVVVVMVGVGVEEARKTHFVSYTACAFSPYCIISGLEDKIPLILGNNQRTRKGSLPLIV